jgi:ParB family chromosome partitioning protein
MNNTISLMGFDDIFTTGTSQNGEHIQMIPLIELHEPDPHPFAVRNDEAMKKLVENIRDYGVREPGLARPYANGGYELLCGNRRKRASEIAGLLEMPVIVREMTDEQAILAMVDSNLQQRENILPSEKAWAYRCRMEALNHNGIKGDQDSSVIMAEQTGESTTQIFRFIRLTELVETLLDMVDLKKLAFTPAVELSHLSYDQQHTVVDCMTKHEVKPSLSQAVKLKKLSQSGMLTAETVDEVLSELKSQAVSKTKEDKTINKFKRFFPDDYTPRQIEKVIISLLQNWKPVKA